MKARPILFNTDMVKAILAGRKTQTRRTLKDQPPEDMSRALRVGFGPLESVQKSGLYRFANSKTGDMWPEGPLMCPYGQPGDLLYVRETFAILDENSVWDGAPVYRASDPCAADRWTPSIHMPRWASRLTLEITDVRVERLQDISEQDALSEGASYLSLPSNALDPMKARTWFRGLWDSIYRNWAENPWVWVVEFKIHHCNVDALLREREAA